MAAPSAARRRHERRRLPGNRLAVPDPAGRGRAARVRLGRGEHRALPAGAAAHRTGRTRHAPRLRYPRTRSRVRPGQRAEPARPGGLDPGRGTAVRAPGGTRRRTGRTRAGRGEPGARVAHVPDPAHEHAGEPGLPVLPRPRGEPAVTLRSPHLDDLTWDALMEATRRRIPAESGGLWTLHAPGDPGVTLLELFAYLLEQRLYWLDQVPDALVVAVLGLLGLD